MEYIREYVWAVGASWFGVVGFVSLLVWLTEVVTPLRVPRLSPRIFGIVAVVCLTIAQYNVWLVEREKVEVEHRQVVALQSEKSKLQGALEAKDDENKRLRSDIDQLRNRLDEARQAPQPEADGLRFVAKQVPGSSSNPYAFEVVVQSQVTMAPFGVELITDKPFAVGQYRIVEAITAENAQDGRRSMTSFWARNNKPGIAPARPWVFVLAGSEPFKVIGAQRITN